MNVNAAFSAGSNYYCVYSLTKLVVVLELFQSIGRSPHLQLQKFFSIGTVTTKAFVVRDFPFTLPPCFEMIWAASSKDTSLKNIMVKFTVPSGLIASGGILFSRIIGDILSSGKISPIHLTNERLYISVKYLVGIEAK